LDTEQVGWRPSIVRGGLEEKRARRSPSRITELVGIKKRPDNAPDGVSSGVADVL
jgi:hypothetical protein